MRLHAHQRVLSLPANTNTNPAKMAPWTSIFALMLIGCVALVRLHEQSCRFAIAIEQLRVALLLFNQTNLTLTVSQLNETLAVSNGLFNYMETSLWGFASIFKFW
jgi:hypothetical protein